jgi:hypothetical protein
MVGSTCSPMRWRNRSRQGVENGSVATAEGLCSRCRAPGFSAEDLFAVPSDVLEVDVLPSGLRRPETLADQAPHHLLSETAATSETIGHENYTVSIET